MIYDQTSLDNIWPTRFPAPQITQRENGIHIHAHPPDAVETHWHIEITANNDSGFLKLDAFNYNEEGLTERIKILASPDRDGNRLQQAIHMVTMLWESTVNELHG